MDAAMTGFDTQEDETASITSTIEEEHDPEDEWVVKDILAEAEHDGKTKYLIEWQGFPLWDASWEPKEHLSGSLLQIWEEEKKKAKDIEQRAHQKVKEWRQAVSERLRGKAARHEERNRKRKQRGMAQTDYGKFLESHLAALDEYPGAEPDDHCLDNPAATSSSAERSQAASGPNQDGNVSSEYSPYSSEDEVMNRGKTSSTTPLQVSGAHRPIDVQSSSSSASNVRPGPHRRHTADSSNFKPIDPPRRASTSSAALKQYLQTSPKRTGPGPAIRKSPNTPSSDIGNVFSGGKQVKKRHTLLDAVNDARKKPQLFGPRLTRKVEKGRRDLEGVMAPATKPAGLFSLDPTAQDSTTSAMVPEEEGTESGGLASAAISNPPVGGPGGLVNLGSSEGENSEQSPFQNALGMETNMTKKKKKSVRFVDQELDSEDNLFIKETTPQLGRPQFTIKLEVGQSPQTPDEKEWTLDSEVILQASSPNPPFGSIQTQSNTRTITKNARFGSANGEQVALTFVGIPNDTSTPWPSHLENQDVLEFTHACSAKDFVDQTAKKSLKAEQLFRGGVISRNGSDKLEVLASRLRLTSTGVLYHNDSFFILIFPSKCEDWEVANQTDLSPPDALLQYDIFRPNSAFNPSLLAPVAVPGKKRDQDPPPGMRPRIHHQFFGFDYNGLLPSRLRDTTQPHFFIACPRSAGDEAALLSRWLRSCNPDCKISASMWPGHWFSFVKLDKGILILHEDAIWTIRRFPKFFNILHQHDNDFSFWLFTKSLQRPEMFPLTEADDKESGYPGDIRLQRIFIPGIAILITPSFLVSQPQQAYNFFKWFWQNFYGTTRRGKLVVCADFADWLLDLALEKAEDRSRALRQMSPQEEEDNALHYEAIEARFKTWNLVRDMAKSPEDIQCPFIVAFDNIDGNDEQSLVNWFGWWSIVNMHQYRKFSVLGSSEACESRLSRCIPIPRFLPHVTSVPSDPLYNAVGGVFSGKDADAELKLVTDDNSETLTNHFNGLIRKILLFKECRILLYKFPVSYWAPGMAHHFRDYHSYFHSFNTCLNFFGRSDAGKGRHRGPMSKFNTVAAFFYTIEGPWDETAYPSDIVPRRRPWIMMHRPINPHRQPYTASELFIWDVCADPRLNRNVDIYESDLIPAQQELIHSVHKYVEEYLPHMPLQAVYLGGFNAPPTEYTHPLDVTLHYLDRLIERLKYWAPAPSKMLPARGWTLVKGGAGPPLTPPRPASDAMDLNTDNEADSLEMRNVFHAPQGDGHDRSPRCRNRLFQHAIDATKQGYDDMDFTFRPTMDWYTEQLAEGRGFEHIKVASWESAFKQYKIPDPKESASRG